MGSVVVDAEGGVADGQARSLLIDADVHEYMPDARVLRPYLDERWHAFLYPNEQMRSGMPYGPPIGTSFLREDWVRDAKDRISEGRGVASQDLDLLREHLFEREGVTHAILCGFYYPGVTLGWYEAFAAIAAAYNDWQIENWLDKDPRLLGSIQIVPQDPQQAADEIDRVGVHPQMVQVFLPLVTEREYGDPMYLPIYEAAARHGLVVTMHHSGNTKTLLGHGYPRTYAEWKTMAAPMATMAQLTSVLFNGVLERIPELKFVFLEAGVAWVPWLLWRMDQQHREWRVEVPWLKRKPSDMVRDQIRVATQPLADIKPREFQQLADMSDTRNIFLFATDYPHYDADTVDVVLPGSLDDDLRERVMWKNAVETYPRLSALVQ